VNKLSRNLAPLALAALMLFAGSSYAGGTYGFRVSCQGGAKVVQWRTGDIDPGKEYLRVATGTNNPGCSVSDYNAARDAGLPVEVKKGGSALWDGSTPVKMILSVIGIKLW
jgi:hypothetical protein